MMMSLAPSSLRILPSTFLRRCARAAFFGGLGALLCLAGARPASAQFQDVGYTFEPTVQAVGESKAAPFQNQPLYGGALGLSFGRYFQASAEYLVNTGLTTNFANVDRLSGLLDRELDLRRFGGRVRFNLYDRRVIPYLTAGAGVLRFDPEGVEASRTIYGLAGGGITFSLYDRYRFSVGGEILSYRYDPVATFLGPNGAQNFPTGTELVSTPALTASASLFLGGRSLDEQTAVDEALREQFGGPGLFRGVRLFLNPFYGRVEFNGALGFPKDQNFAGLNAGVSLGPYVGLRGFYWRGTEGASLTDAFAEDFQDLAMYGGELKLRLNLGVGGGFVPYAKVGGGYLDVFDGYEGDIPTGTTPPEDRFFGITGAGLEVPLTRSINFSGGARGLFMSNPNAVAAGDPGDLYGSLMYTAGIEFRIGGDGRAQPGPEPGPVPGSGREGEAEGLPASTGADRTAEGDPSAPATLTDRERRLLARADSLERALQALQADPSSGATASSGPSSASADGEGRTMTVPVPEEGEIYIRFGDGRAMRPRRDTARAVGRPPVAEQSPLPTEEVERRVQRALRQQLQRQAPTDSVEALTEARLDRIVQRAVQRAVRQQESPRPQQPVQDRRIRRLERQIEDLQAQLREERSGADRGEPVAAPAVASQPPFYRETLGRPLLYLVPITGFRAGEGPDQFQIGLRGDYRSTPTSQFHLIPELSFGLGDGEIAPTLLFNAAYSFLRATTTEFVGAPIEPYVGAGVGIASDGGFTFEPVTNVMTGVDYRLGSGSLFIEYSTLDFFNTHRVHLGYRARF